MARILLGVSGGIAAYKALELVRLATKAGHAVRVVQTPTSTRFVGAASFAGLTGAPVLVDEFEPDPARGAYPGDRAADPRADQPSGAGRQRRRVPDRSGERQHDRQARQRPCRQPRLTTAALAARCPVLVAPAMNDAMWEHPATQANVATLAARGVTMIEPEVGALGSKGEWGVGRFVEPPALLAARRGALGVDERAAVGRRAGARHGRRHARADRLGALRRQPLVGTHGRRAGRRRGAAAPR